MDTQTDCVVQISRYTQLRLTVWLRGIEVAVRGYIEPADRPVGIMQECLVVEELVPVVPDPRWREPDIDDLLDSGEYQGISNAFFDTWRAETDHYWYDWDYELEQSEAHQDWRAYWLGAGDLPCTH